METSLLGAEKQPCASGKQEQGNQLIQSRQTSCEIARYALLARWRSCFAKMRLWEGQLRLRCVITSALGYCPYWHFEPGLSSFR